MPSARRTKSYKYDAALSFAGEDRAHAEALSRQLRRLGLSVFYDVEHQARLWGRSTREFDEVYGSQSRYVIPLISKHYVSKDWPRYEFETAKREEHLRRGEFILPIRVDDSRMLGLRDDVITLDIRRHNAKHVAELFAAKCRPHRGTLARVALGGQLKTDNFWTGKTDNSRRPRLVSSTSMCPPSASPCGLSSASFSVRT